MSTSMMAHFTVPLGAEISGDGAVALVTGAALVVIIALWLAWVRTKPANDLANIVKKPRGAASMRPAAASQRYVPSNGWRAENGSAAPGATLTAKGTGGQEFNLGREPSIIGSSSEGCTIVLAGEGIAPEHARIWYRQGKFLLHHVGGLSRKTYVSGHEADWVVLESGDEVSIGPHRLVFTEPGPAAGGVTTEDLEPAGPDLVDDLTRMEAAVRELWAEAAPASETAVGQRSGTGKYKVHRRKDELAARVGGQWVKRGRTVVLER